jgi:hypothetical protein
MTQTLNIIPSTDSQKKGRKREMRAQSGVVGCRMTN